MLSDPLVKFSGAGVNMRNTFFEMVSAGEPIYCDLKLLKNLNNLCIWYFSLKDKLFSLILLNQAFVIVELQYW